MAGISSGISIHLHYLDGLAWASHQANLFQHPHEIVEQVFLDDLAIDPVGHGTEIYLKAFVRGRNHRAVSSLHRPFHRSCELSDGTGPLSLRDHHLVRTIADTIVREGFEHLNTLLLVRHDAKRRWLVRPVHDAILSMTLAKCLPVLRVPGIVQRLHQLQVLLWG